MKKLWLLCSVAAFLSSATSYSAEKGKVHKWVDKYGVVNYTSSPPPPGATPYQEKSQATASTQNQAQNSNSGKNSSSGQSQNNNGSVVYDNSQQKNDGWETLPKKQNQQNNNGSNGQDNSNANGKDQKWVEPPPRISKEAAAKCEKYFSGLGVNKQDIPRLCDDTGFVDPLITANFDECRKQINSVTQNRYGELLCYEITRTAQVPLNQEVLHCLAESIDSAEPTFFFYEVITKAYQKNKAEYTVKDCIKGFDRKNQANKPTIVNQFHYHSSLKRSKSAQKDLLGGLSGIWWDRHQQKYNIVSDNQRFPFMVETTWNPLDPQSVPKFTTDISIQHANDRGYKNYDRFDFEEIVKLSNGNFVVSSEVDDQKPDEDDGGFFAKFKSKKAKKENEKVSVPLVEISKTGDIIREIPVADAIQPKNVTVIKQYDCTPYIAPSNNNDNGSYRGDQKQDHNNQNYEDGNFRFESYQEKEAKKEPSTSGTTGTLSGAVSGIMNVVSNTLKSQPAPTTASTTTTRPQKKMCQSSETYRGQGFESNRGVEAISYLESTNELFYGTEGPLIQDKGQNKKEFVRIYRQTMGNEAKTQKYIKYPINNEFDNGMPAMIALNENDMLILERGFDSMERKTHIKIFKINWNKLDSEGYAMKKLIVEMNDLQNQMPAGFRRFDNLEGMTLGPETATHLTVVLVSDNNFSQGQVTQFVAVQIPKELLR